MKPGDIVEVYKTRFKKILKFYRNLLEDFESGDIHHFRLEMKKLKAFLHLVYIESEKHHSKIPKDLKLLYNLAGNIRNLELHQKRIVDMCNDLLLEIPVAYMQRLHDEERTLKMQARQTAKNVFIKHVSNKLTEKVPDKLTGRMQNDFIQKKLARLRELLALSFYTDEALHEVRKIMKDLMYNSKYIAAEELIRFFPDFPGLRSISAITVSLGDYHDLCIGLSLLNSTYVTEITDANEVHVLNEIKMQLQVRKDIMRIEIVKLMKRLDQGFLSKQNPDISAVAVALTTSI